MIDLLNELEVDPIINGKVNYVKSKINISDENARQMVLNADIDTDIMNDKFTIRYVGTNIYVQNYPKLCDGMIYVICHLTDIWDKITDSNSVVVTDPNKSYQDVWNEFKLKIQ